MLPLDELLPLDEPLPDEPLLDPPLPGEPELLEHAMASAPIAPRPKREVVFIVIFRSFVRQAM